MVFADVFKATNCDKCNETRETWTLEETNIIGNNTRLFTLDISVKKRHAQTQAYIQIVFWCIIARQQLDI